MGNRAFTLVFLLTALSLFVSAASALFLSRRRKCSVRMGILWWAVFFISLTLPLNLGNSPLDVLFYENYSGGVRIQALWFGEKWGQLILSGTWRRILEGAAELLVLVWLWGGAASFSYGMSSYFNNLHFLTKRSHNCRDERVNTVFAGAMAKAGLKRHVSLRVMDGGLKISPCTCGILSHSIFVGEDYLKDYSDDWLELVFLHELIHIRHRDTLLKLATLLFCSLHRYLPLSRRIRQTVVEDCELRCDRDVLRICGDGVRGSYVAVILDVAERNLKTNCRDGELLSSVSAAGAFLMERYRQMQNRKCVAKTAPVLLPLLLSSFAVNALLFSAVDVPNLSNPGVDVADELTRLALCDYFGLDNPEQLTVAHLDAVYALAYEAADHRALVGDDMDVRFTRRVVINEGLYLTEDGMMPARLPENGEQTSCGVLPNASRADRWREEVHPAAFYTIADEAQSPVSRYFPVVLLRDDPDENALRDYLLSLKTSPAHSIWLLGDHRLDLRDLPLFTGLRTLSVSEIFLPEGYELEGEAGFALIREEVLPQE